MSIQYLLNRYSINISRNGEFLIEYIFETPAYLYDFPNDDYYQGKVFHKVREQFNEKMELMKFKYNLSSKKEYNSAGEVIKTNYNENDLKRIVKNTRSEFLNLIKSKGFYNKILLKNNEYKMVYFWGLELYFNSDKQLISIKNTPSKIEMFKYWEEDSSIVLLPNYKDICTNVLILKYINRTKPYTAEYVNGQINSY